MKAKLMFVALVLAAYGAFALYAIVIISADLWWPL